MTSNHHPSSISADSKFLWIYMNILANISNNSWAPWTCVSVEFSTFHLPLDSTCHFILLQLVSIEFSAFPSFRLFFEPSSSHFPQCFKFFYPFPHIFPYVPSTFPMALLRRATTPITGMPASSSLPAESTMTKAEMARVAAINTFHCSSPIAVPIWI